MKQGRVYFWLICLVLVQGLCLTVGNVSQYWKDVFPSFRSEQWQVIQGVFVAASIAYALVLIRNLVRAAGQEAEMRAQAAQMANVTELLRAMRAQRHDFINHVQALYGLVKAGDTEEALRYIREVYGEVKQASSLLQVGEPALVSLFQAKMGEAEAKGVYFSMQVDPQFRTIPVAAKDLNRIIGNLLDNALEAAEDLEAGGRWVEVELSVEKNCYQIRVANGGEIAEGVRRHLFRSGFSTKTAGGHQGLGLYAVQTLAGRYGGLVRAESGNGRTIFTVTFPAAETTLGRRSSGQRA